MVCSPLATLGLASSYLGFVDLAAASRWIEKNGFFRRTAPILFARAFLGNSLSSKWSSNNDIPAEPKPER